MEHKEVIGAILGIVAITLIVSMVVHNYQGIPGRNFHGSTGWAVSGTPGLNMYWRGCTEGATQCAGTSAGANFLRCTRGVWKLDQYCSANADCDPEYGCR